MCVNGVNEMNTPDFPDAVRRRMEIAQDKQFRELGLVKGQPLDCSEYETAETLAQEAEIKAMLETSPRFLHLGGLL